MAHIRSFSAIHYHKARFPDVSAVIAPPFDVLDAAQKAALQAKHPNNIVNVDLPHIPPKAAGPAEVYEKSDVTLRSWLNAGILVREAPRLAARAVLFLEELAQLAGVSFTALVGRVDVEGGLGHRSASEAPAPAPVAAPAPAADPSLAETVLRQTDDLKKIVETVEREVIDRAMRRVEGNQSRGAQVLNISRGSLIAKLKEFGIPDYRYLRRERSRR